MRRAIHSAPGRLTEETDAFGHRDYAEALTDVLLEAEPPFTAGLFGAWGVGKTTIINEVGARLRADHTDTTAFVTLAAWRSEGGSFRREFLREAEQQLAGAGALRRRHRRVTSDLYATSTRSHERAGWSPARLLQLALALAVLGGLLYLAGVRRWHDVVHSTDLKPPIVVFLALFAVIAYVLNLVLAVIQPRTASVTSLRLEEPERFVERFADLLGDVTKRRVIVAIDDVDRMSAAEAVEILRTVKTFLEPTTVRGRGRPAPPAVVFVVAADRAVLRAHLAAHLSEGAPRFGDTRTPEQLADDYLAKFFSASVSVRPVLDDDMHVYMRAHVAELTQRIVPERRLDERIVRMCVAGLRHNPRRVEQFVNTMQLRWQLVRARERSREADDGDALLSSDLATIVKLALIEEEWPQAFERLQERPGLLATWNALAAEGSTPGEHEWGGEDWEAFASFLRASVDVSPASLRPFLRLRRTVVERDLPRYDTFHDAAVSPGSAEAVAAFVQELDYDLITRYAARMTDIMREQLSDGNLDGTVHCLDAALNVSHRTGQGFDFRAILEAAVAEPALTTTLQRVSPTPLVYAARVIGGHVQSRVEMALADQIIATASRGEAPADTARALAEGPLTPLSPAAEERLRCAFASPPLIDAFAHYLPLLEARRIGFPAGAAEHALQAVTAPRDRAGLRAAGAAWEVLVQAVHEHKLESEHDALLQHFGAVLSQGADDAELTQHLEDIAGVSAALQRAGEEPRLLVAESVSAVAQRVPGTWRLALKITIDLSGGDWGGDRSVARFVAYAAAFLPGARAVPVETESYDEWHSAAEWWAPTLAAAVVAAEARGDHDGVKWLADEYGWCRGIHATVAPLYLARLERGSRSRVEAEILIQTEDRLAPSDRPRLRALIPTWHTATAHSDGPRVLHDRAWRMFDADDLAETLVELLTDSSTAPSDSLVGAVFDRVGDVGKAARERLRAVLAVDGGRNASSAALRELTLRLNEE